MINTYDYTLKQVVAEKGYLFQIPNYQRSYVWTEKEILRFVRDGYFCMQKYNGKDREFEHYAGQMIFKTVEKRHDGKERLQIIDGQQRLTTFQILVAAVSDLLKKSGKYFEDESSLRLKYLLLSSVPETAEKETVLSLSKKDQNFWHSMMEGDFFDKTELKVALESQKRIWKAYNIIRDYCLSIIADLSEDEQVKYLLTYIDALSESFRVLVLTTENPGHEYALFQIVNDRGLPLTAGELLKARTIELLTSQDKTLKRERLARTAEGIWEDILSDSGATTEKYLIWNYIAMLGSDIEDIKKVPLNEQYEKKLFQCLDKREISLDMQDQILEQLEDLRDNIQRCRELENGKFPVKGASSSLNLFLGILIRNMRDGFCIPLYLKILAVNREKDALSIAETLTPMLIRTFFIAKVMGKVNDESIMNCYLTIWNKLEKSVFNEAEIKECFEKLLKKDKCKAEFYVKINQSVYDRGAGNLRAKFLLLMTELQSLKEKTEDSTCCGDDSVEIVFDKLSVEHILYKGVNENEVSEDFYQSIHRLGNLTILGERLNSKQQAKPFEEKRSFYNASPYFITREVGTLKAWNYRDYKKRQERLVNVVKRAFEL